MQAHDNFFRRSRGDPRTDMRTRLALADHSIRWRKVSAAQAGHYVEPRLAFKEEETGHRDESFIRHSRGSNYDGLRYTYLIVSWRRGPFFLEGGPRIISLSHSFDVGTVARPSVMEATRRQRFLKRCVF